MSLAIKIWTRICRVEGNLFTAFVYMTLITNTITLDIRHNTRIGTKLLIIFDIVQLLVQFEHAVQNVTETSHCKVVFMSYQKKPWPARIDESTAALVLLGRKKIKSGFERSDGWVERDRCGQKKRRELERM